MEKKAELNSRDPAVPFVHSASDAPSSWEGEVHQHPAGAVGTLSPKTVTLWRMSVLAWTLLIAAIAAFLGWTADRALLGQLGAVAVLSAGLIVGVVWPPARYKRWSFTVGAHDVVIRRGVLWRTTSIVPHARIQHVDTTHGPLERKLGLSSVVLFTAGTTGASIRIPGLPAAQADELRDTLAALGRTGEAL